MRVKRRKQYNLHDGIQFTLKDLFKAAVYAMCAYAITRILHSLRERGHIFQFTRI